MSPVHDDTIPVADPTVKRHKDGTYTVNFGHGIHHHANADVAMSMHYQIVQEVYRLHLEAEAAAEAAK